MSKQKCWSCGCDVPYDGARVTYCETCKKKHDERLEKLKSTKRKISVELMAIKAVDTIARDKHRESDLYAYKKAYKVVIDSAREVPAMFDSSEEMAVAICLYQQKKHFQVQYKVGSRKVDLCIPEEKLLIEIDGSRHENREYQDTVRDIEILQQLGEGWEIAHIPASFVNEKPTRVYGRAYSIAKDKREHREKNGYTIAPEIAKALMYKRTHKANGAKRF